MQKALPWLAAMFCSPCLALQPAEIEAHYQSCVAQMETAPAAAIGCFETLHRLDQPSANSLYYLGRLYLRTQQSGPAVAAFEQALALDPSDRWAVQALLDALDADGQQERSLKAAELAQQNFPEHAGFAAYRVLRYQSQEQLPQAHAARQQLLALVAQGKTDGLASEQLYLRQRLQVGEVSVHALEYFDPAPDQPRYVFIARFPDGQEHRYQTTYRAELEEEVRRTAGAQALPYFFDVFEPRRQRLVSFIAREPVFEALRDLVISDLRAPRTQAGFSYGSGR